MSDPAFRTLQLVNAAAFVLVGLLAFRDWWQGRDRSRAYLAVALGGLGLVALVATVEAATTVTPGLTAVAIVLFMASGAGLLLYRHQVIPLPRWPWIFAAAAMVGVTVFNLMVGVDGGPATKPTPVQTTAGLLLALVWCGCVAEPAYRLWQVSRSLAAVKRARLRSLSAGYAGIALVVVLSVGASFLGANQLVQDGLQLLALGCVPLLYCGFAPPAWLRLIWRQPEEEALRGAVRELLLFSPDRATLGRRALDWGIRLVGGDAGLIADAGLELLAHQGMSATEAHALLNHPGLMSSRQLPPQDSGTEGALVLRLPVETGTGVLVVIPGALSPAFGAEEMERLESYSAAITIALDRARTSERVIRSEMELSAARDTAQAANRAKSEFLSRMSHELRTPLTAMMGFAELLGLDELTDQQRRYIATILKAGDHLLALVNDVLDIARIEEGRLSMSLEPISVADLVEEVLDLARPLANERGISVRVRPAADNPHVVADHQRLKQVMLNLVSNAVKYNSDHGSVQIVVTPSNGSIRIAVLDTGRGLRDDEIARLFSPFERLSASRTDIQGTGLGLALSKSLTEAMRGRIGVESTAGKGSTFWVEFPVADAELCSPEEAPALGHADTDVQGVPKVMLYVEDTVSNIRLVEGIVSRRPHITLIPAMQGTMAMELARKHHPDLILLDVHLPDIEGADLLQQFRTDPATAEVPVIMLSADATQRQVDRFIAAGAVAYLTKPIRVSLLLAELDRHLAPAKATV